MAGHSKWANIKHRKERQDSLKSKKFQKIVGEIKKLAILNPNSDTNFELKKLIEQAKKENVPNEVIQRSLKKFLNVKNNSIFWCEARFAKKINFLVKISTDNFLRSLHNIKEIIKKTKTEVFSNNSIKFLFETLYEIIIEKKFEDVLLECLENIEVKKIEEKEDKIFLIFNDSLQIKKLKKNFLSKNIEIINSIENLKPFKKNKLSEELKKEYFELKEKILNLPECQEIFDDLDYEV